MFAGLIAAMMVLDQSPHKSGMHLGILLPEPDRHYTMVIIRPDGRISPRSSRGLARENPEEYDRQLMHWKKLEREYKAMRLSELQFRLRSQEELVQSFQVISGLKSASSEGFQRLKRELEKSKTTLDHDHLSRLVRIEDKLRMIEREIFDLEH